LIFNSCSSFSLASVEVMALILVFGYLHWSLTDNFEWDSGYYPKFGLIEIDFENDFKRKLRPSATVYHNLIKKYGKL